MSPRDALAAIVRNLDDFRGNRPFGDDLTLLILEFNSDAAVETAHTA